MLVAKRLRFWLVSFNKDKNYYHILGVTAGSSQDEIKRAYRQLAKKHHPDISQGNQDVFKNINEAYEVLSDQATRNQYDSERITHTYHHPSTQNPNSRPYQHPSSRPGPHSSRRWQQFTAEEKEMLQMMRRHQQEYMRQYQRPFREKQRQRQYRGYQSQQEAMEDEYIRRYYQNARKRNPKQAREYNERFDRSKDSVLRNFGQGVKGLWAWWKQLKHKK